MPTLELKIPPPVVGAIVAAGMWGVSTVGPQWSVAPALRIAAVCVLVAAGLTLDLSGLLAFRASRTTIHPLRPERTSALVTEGVYRVTRNPMYLGMACLLLAWAVHLSALLPFAGIFAFVFYITRFQIQAEERVLSGAFGERYARYAARVRRWL